MEERERCFFYFLPDTIRDCNITNSIISFQKHNSPVDGRPQATMLVAVYTLELNFIKYYIKCSAEEENLREYCFQNWGLMTSLVRPLALSWSTNATASTRGTVGWITARANPFLTSATVKPYSKSGRYWHRLSSGHWHGLTYRNNVVNKLIF
jgi:hypothetical protein